MKAIGRHDRVLLVGFAVAAIVVFARPVRYLLDVAAEVERNSGLTLVPALVILAVFFVFHLQTKQQEARADVLRAESERAQADARTADMEQLVGFGQALARALDFESIHDVLAQQLPALAGSHDVWVLVRRERDWFALLAPAGVARQDAAVKFRDIADRALAGELGAIAPTVVVEGSLCLPLTAGGRALGVVGLPHAHDGVHGAHGARRRTFAAALTLLGISVRNAQLFREVRENSLRDALTGCYNKAHAVEMIETELRRARRSHAPTSLIIFDLDHFKEINDRYGHLCGDAVLAAVGAKMRGALRSSDVKCRYGGEEFLVLLPDTPLAGAKHVAESLRRELADNTPVTWQGQSIHVTASFGVTAALPSEVDLQAFVGRADAALYRAKEQGRNCIRLAIEAAVA